jgi:serine phosphatase RsbU (regulator of sigma subunit)
MIGKWTGVPGGLTVGSWRWSFNSAAMIVLGAATLVLFVRDLVEDRHAKQQWAAELAASRAVQLVLIPNEIPPIPGFTIRSVYEPFGEVGGDFFQILPLPNGGLLIAIGDVSGKGMPAAMLVSLLVGTLHALVETTTSPGQLLAGLNRLIQGRSHGGFTTCLILRVEQNGMVTFANAGHISPYRNGLELASENGLPLGLLGDSAYDEARFQLKPGEQMTLVTDGVVEARNESGELLGFERTATLSSNSAEEIAQAAQAFGQEDDITVLTVRSVAACG